jgi:hypothetical protein
MARSFASASSQFLKNSNAVVTAAPLTIAAWFRQVSAAATNYLVSIADTGTDNNYFALQVNTSAQVGARTQSSASFVAALSSGAFSADVWTHGCAVFAAANDRRAYRDGGNKGTEATSVTPSGLDATAIGRLEKATPSLYENGRLAEVAIWNVALTDAEVASIAKGVSPPYIQPAALVGYWPLWGDHSPEIDLTFNARSMTVTGATKADHPPVMPYNYSLWVPSSPMIQEAAPAGHPTMRRWGGVPGMTPGPMRHGRSW